MLILVHNLIQKVKRRKEVGQAHEDEGPAQI